MGGTAVNWVGGGSDSRTYLNGGGRDFRVNPDGSISLFSHPHLALGVFDPETKPSRTSRVIDSGLVLVRAGSPGVLRFDHFQALQAGMAAPLTCNASHPGNGIGTKYPEERMLGEWRYTESKMVAAQNACMAQLVQGKFIKRVDANLVLDVAFWVFQEGTAVNWAGGGSDSRTYLNGGGRDFRVNPDGSISLVNHPHLALGVSAAANTIAAATAATAAATVAIIDATAS